MTTESSSGSTLGGQRHFNITHHLLHVIRLTLSWEMILNVFLCILMSPMQIERLVTLKAVHTRGASLVNSVAELEAAQQGIKAELAVLRSAVQQVRSGRSRLALLLYLLHPTLSF